MLFTRTSLKKLHGLRFFIKPQVSKSEIETGPEGPVCDYKSNLQGSQMIAMRVSWLLKNITHAADVEVVLDHHAVVVLFSGSVTEVNPVYIGRESSNCG